MLTILTGVLKRRFDLRAGLVGHWRMDEASGTTAADSSPSGIAGTLSGGAAFVPSGAIGGAVDLDGTGKVTLADPFASLLQSADKTVVLWAFKTSAPLNTETRMFSIFRGTTGEGNGQTAYTISAGGIGAQVLRYRYWNGSGVSDLGGAVQASTIVNDWHMLALVQSGTTAIAYLDNQAIDSANNASTVVPTNPPNAVIGGYNINAEFFEGMIDDVRLYNRALSAAEIAALYALGPAA